MSYTHYVHNFVNNIQKERWYNYMMKSLKKYWNVMIFYEDEWLPENNEDDF